jgi:quinol monooxygenase YgiN
MMLQTLAVALTLIAEPNAVYVATYIDAQPASVNAAASLIKSYGETVKAEKGNLAIDIVQETGRPARWVVIEVWNDAPSFEAHKKAASTAEFQNKVKAIQNSPNDERTHKGLSVDSKSWVFGRGSVAVVTHVDVPPPVREQAQALLTKVAEASRADEGNLRYDVLQESPQRTNHFTIFAVWKDRKAFDSHEGKPHARQFREAIAPMLGAPYDERMYTSQ